MSKAEQLATVLDEFLSVSLDVEAAAVVSSDGLPMASALPPDVQEDRLAAMSAALLSLGERAAMGLDKGDLAQVYVEGSAGNVVLMAAGRHAVLVAMTAKHAKAGLVLYEMRSSARQVERVLEEPVVVDAEGFTVVREAVPRHSVEVTPAAPPEESPYSSISEVEPPSPSWEGQAVQATPEWEAQPAAEGTSSSEWVEHAEGDLEQDQQASEQVDESTEQWGQQQPEEAQQEDQPKQWDDEQKDENSSFTSW